MHTVKAGLALLASSYAAKGAPVDDTVARTPTSATPFMNSPVTGKGSHFPFKDYHDRESELKSRSVEPDNTPFVAPSPPTPLESTPDASLLNSSTIEARQGTSSSCDGDYNIVVENGLDGNKVCYVCAAAPSDGFQMDPDASGTVMIPTACDDDVNVIFGPDDGNDQQVWTGQ